MMAANAALLALKAERAAEQRAQEEALRVAMMAKFAEDDRIEQLNAQRRRLKVRGAWAVCVWGRWWACPRPGRECR
jgi:hypothetical protein